jgi:hypothetical protein
VAKTTGKARREQASHNQSGGGDVHIRSRRASRPDAGTVNGETWRAYIELFRSEGSEKESVTFNGCWLSDTQVRTLYRWLKEGAAPQWHKADRFLVACDLSWTFFEQWAEQEGLPLWEDMPPKEWDQ